MLEVNSLKPIVKGTDISEALGVKSGKWMTDALNMVIDWQLRNPNEADTAKAIAEVQTRKDELTLPG